jgi:hypothetical protein
VRSLTLKGGFYWNLLFCCDAFFKKVGMDFSDLTPVAILSVELVEEVYFKCLRPFCSKMGLLKYCKLF